VLVLLAVVVLLPTVGFLWFARQAMQNERLAVRERLGQVYTTQLEGLRDRVRSFWEQIGRAHV
jgi:uncharacterized membrane protein